MKRALLLLGSIFLGVATSFAQEKICKKNTGNSYISSNDFTNVLLEKQYNSVSDINLKNNNLRYHWRLKSNNQECELCEHIFADITPNWDSENFSPNQVVMRYIIRPSTNNIVLNYTYNIINDHIDNSLITKLVEVNTGKEKIINLHYNEGSNSVEKQISVVPGRSYYVDIVANYTSHIAKTVFQFDNLKITEQILSGSLVFNHSNHVLN